MEAYILTDTGSRETGLKIKKNNLLMLNSLFIYGERWGGSKNIELDSCPPCMKKNIVY
jgi:hypothetical protein